MTRVVVTVGCRPAGDGPRAASAAALTLCALAACQHYQTELPGTLDLRSDGAEAPLATDPLPRDAARGGLEAWMKGAGTAPGEGTTVIAEDRALWALRLFPLGDGAAAEVGAALGKGGALRAVSLKEEISLFDAALFACTLPIPCVDLASLTMLPSFTVQVAGTRVQPSGMPSARDAQVPLPTAGAPVAPPAAPTPALDRPSGAAGGAP